MKPKAMLLALLALLLFLVSNTFGMRSDNFWLDWYTRLTSCGGGSASSTNYAVNLTVGQVGIGASSSTNYEGCVGYWCGVEQRRFIWPGILLLLLDDD